MKVLLTLLCLCAASQAWPQIWGSKSSKEIDSVTMLQKQQSILHLLEHLYEDIHDASQKKLAHDYKPSEHEDKFYHPEEMKEFMEYYEHHEMLERGHHFTLFDPHHREGMIKLFKMLMNAKDWDTLHACMCWARAHVNEGQFSYALTVVVTHRPDLKGIKLPAPYEINPHLFVPSSVIQAAYSAKMKQESITIPMGFTGTKKNPEQRVAYFGEDFGLNSHHYYWHIDFPFWWREEFGPVMDRKGELFYYMHHQLTARFDAERLSNHLPIVEPLDWETPIKEGFSPRTTYRKEGEFPSRPDDMHFHDLPFLTRRDMTNFEFRVRDAIAHGYAVDDHGHKVPLNETDGINVLGAMIESSEHSVNKHFYGALHNYGHVMLGKVTDPDGKFGLPPSVMEHFETATRDPAFFRLHKYIDSLFKEHKDFLHEYTEAEIGLPGVHVEDIKITDVERADHPNELVTFFDHFDIHLDNALYHKADQKDTDIKAEGVHLNHDDFTYTFTIKSDSAHTAAVRIFMAPKYDSNDEEIDLDHQRWMMIEMDKFVVHLKSGVNKVERSSKQSSVTAADPVHFHDLLKETDEAIKKKDDKYFHHDHRHCGIPQRLLLPKGTELGMEFDLYVVVSDYTHEPDKEDLDSEFGGTHSYCGRLGGKYPDDHAMGFPFDRPIHDGRKFVSHDNIGHLVVKIKHDPKIHTH
uniref:Hemocyanin 1 n=1 Tax=Argulus foliaceus TaxID=509924 RepID=A0A0M7BHC4_9CRUS|nr:hemocyanin 1 [Argulus foliaceus]